MAVRKVARVITEAGKYGSWSQVSPMSAHEEWMQSPRVMGGGLRYDKEFYIRPGAIFCATKASCDMPSTLQSALFLSGTWKVRMTSGCEITTPAKPAKAMSKEGSQEMISTLARQFQLQCSGGLTSRTVLTVVSERRETSTIYRRSC